ncbi:hypothetical protein AYO45_04750 [Gammaproteobacteria bacterium SCGC AG-212-F23]|nr:hypothetical protein AYO45_04750 [Gammaproteobacteria bacterium SCGC AG-212-F23]
MSNSELVNMVDQLKPNKKLTIIKARYPYGAKIINQGVLQLPTFNGELISLNESKISQQLKNKLSYSPIPLALSINKGCEVYLENSENTIPLNLLPPNNLFGLFETVATMCNITTKPIWSVLSGARSLFMLPKISDQVGYSRIRRKLDVSLNTPQSLKEHFNVFQAIYDNSSSKKDWYCDIIFFTNDWFRQDTTNSRWLVFYNYLFKLANAQRIRSPYNVDNMALIYSLWENFLFTISSRNLKPRPYIVNTIKYLIEIAVGMRPGFCTIENEQNFAPCELLQDTYINIYGLKKYAPTLFFPQYLSKDNNIKSVYYSLSHPILLEGIPKSRGKQDIISDMREIKYLLNILSVAVKNDKINLPNQRNLLDNIKYDFFHNGIDIFNEIRSSKEVLLFDPNLTSYNYKKFSHKEFCSTSPFFSGCISISIDSSKQTL